MKWFRFYHEAIDDPKVQMLEPVLFKFWVNMLCLASRSDERGTIQLSACEIAFALRMPPTEVEILLSALVDADLIAPGTDGLDIHNWDKRQFKSDDVSARVAGHRNAMKRDTNVDATLPEQGDDPDVTTDETLHETTEETLKPSARADPDTETDSDTEKTQTQNARASLRDAFETFWRAYPSGHGNIQAAWAAWQAIDPDEELVELIGIGLEIWKASDRWQRGYVKAAQTWLRERWFDDEPPPPADDAEHHGRDRPWLDTPDRDAPFDFLEGLDRKRA